MCTITDCSNKLYAKGLCNVHYIRKRKGMDLNKPLQMRGGDDKVRFLQYVNKTDSCWLWTGFQRGKGYGGFQLSDGIVSAHRFAYEHFVGKIPDGLQIDHLCSNKLCVNPKHLEPVNNSENQYRAKVKRGFWPIQGRKPKTIKCLVCGKTVESIMYERKKYCGNACRCKAQRARKAYLTHP